MNHVEEAISKINGSKVVLEKLLGFKLNYKPQSLKQLEKHIKDQLAIGRPIPDAVRILFAVYLGETINQNIKAAKWIDNNDLYQLHLEIPVRDGLVKAYVMPRIDKFIEYPTESLYAFYAMIQDIHRDRIDYQKALKDNNGFVDSPRGYSFRALEMPNDLYEKVQRGELSHEEAASILKKRHDNNSDES